MIDFAIILIPNTILPGNKFLKPLLNKIFRKVKAAQKWMFLDHFKKLIKSNRIIFSGMRMFQFLN
jgi:hypothetical protein